MGYHIIVIFAPLEEKDMLSALLARILSVSLIAVLAGSVNSSSRFYEAATSVSAAAFDLQINDSGAHGQYLYAYLAPSANGPKVRSMRYEVRINGMSIAFRNSFGQQCRSWSLRRLTAHELSVAAGAAVATYTAVQRDDYTKQLQALKSTADALRGHGGGLTDLLKPMCPA